MAHEYATSTTLKHALSLAGETFVDPEIALALSAASRAVDNHTHRRFYPDEDALQERYYTPEDRGFVVIDDLAELTSLHTDPLGDGTFGDSWTQDSDFTLEPLNAEADGRPWDAIQVHPRTSLRLPVGYPRSVKVIGQFGWATAPEAVTEATMIIASRLIKRVREAPFGVVTAGIEEGAFMRLARVDPDVSSLLATYVRRF